MDPNRQQTALLDAEDELDMREPAWSTDQRGVLKAQLPGDSLPLGFPAYRSQPAGSSSRMPRTQPCGEDD